MSQRFRSGLLTRPMGHVEWVLSNVLIMCVALMCFTAAQVYLGDQDDFFVGDKVIFAVNCGGSAHTDINGVKYQKDLLPMGTPSDHGRRYIIGRVNQADQVLYQTERYHTSDFSYTIPIPDDGHYVLVLKFSEVYFTQPDMKVFDVLVNDHYVVSYLDIFSKVGHAIAYDEHVPMIVQNDRLTFIGTAKTIPFDGKLKVTFQKGTKDNPKVNALYLLRGTSDDVPQLPPLDQAHGQVQPDQNDVEEHLDTGDRQRRQAEKDEDPERRTDLASGPKVEDPYDTMEQSQMFLPILVALACFFPLLYCLCKI